MYNFAMPFPRILETAALAGLVLCTFLPAVGVTAEVKTSAPAEQRVSDAVRADAVREGFSNRDASLTVFGWIEKVILSPELQWQLDAKLDTGADTSSLDATGMRRVRYKGKSYVRFSIQNPETGDMVSLRRPYVRTVRIRQHNGDHQRRRVVLMTVCLGSEQRTIEVTLADRGVFDYPMLLGRSALAGMALVYPMKTYTANPQCTPLATDSEDVASVDAQGSSSNPSQDVVSADPG